MTIRACAGALCLLTCLMMGVEGNAWGADAAGAAANATTATAGAQSKPEQQVATRADDRPTTSPTSAGDDLELIAELESLERKLSQTQDLTTKFTQEKHTALLRKPLISSGIIRIRGNLMRWDTQKPTESVMLIGEKEIQLYYPKQKLLEIYAIDQQLARLAASPIPRIALMREHFYFQRRRLGTEAAQPYQSPETKANEAGSAAGRGALNGPRAGEGLPAGTSPAADRGGTIAGRSAERGRLGEPGNGGGAGAGSSAERRDEHGDHARAGVREGAVAVVLTPKQETLRQHIERVGLLIDRETTYLREMEMVDADGDRTVIRFSDVKLNSGVTEKEMELRPAPGTRISRPMSAEGAQE